MSKLSKVKLSYEYNETYPEIKKLIRQLTKIKPHDRAKIKRLRKEGFTATELGVMYDVTPQKITAIVKGSK